MALVRSLSIISGLIKLFGSKEDKKITHSSLILKKKKKKKENIILLYALMTYVYKNYYELRFILFFLLK